MNVTATTIEPVATTGTAFPSRISGATDTDTDMSGTVDGTEVGNAANTDVRILQAAPALTASLGEGSTGYVVDLTDRTKIDRGRHAGPECG